MFLHNETIMLCGGGNNLKTCFKLQEGTWTKYNSLKEERRNAAGVSTATATFIFGGHENRDTYEYLEKYESEWKLGETRIPDGLWNGCSIAISQDEIWLIGGVYNEHRILSFNLTNQIFKKLHIKLDQGRYGHQCAFVPGTRHLMITGGHIDNEYINDISNSTVIIDVEARNVSGGPPMNSKRAVHGIGVLNIKGHERLVVFGGEGENYNYLKSVEGFNAQTQKWELTNIELSEAKKDFGFMTIKSQP